MSLTVAAAVALAQLGYGAYQTYQGYKAGQQKQPLMAIPESAKRQLAVAQLMAADKKLPEIGRASCREECRSRWSPYH
jgi:uncharacterized membrane protein YebE (DUF533 family)